jgi:hypothetical protein
MDEQQFQAKYGFNNYQIITVTNPTEKDYEFQAVIEVGMDVATGKIRVEPRKYIVRAGGTERFPGPVALLYLDAMAKLISQDEGNFAAMIDPFQKATYYDSLIASTEDMIDTYRAFDNAEVIDRGEVGSVVTKDTDEEEAFATTAKKPARKSAEE